MESTEVWLEHSIMCRLLGMKGQRSISFKGNCFKAREVSQASLHSMSSVRGPYHSGRSEAAERRLRALWPQLD